MAVPVLIEDVLGGCEEMAYIVETLNHPSQESAVLRKYLVLTDKTEMLDLGTLGRRPQRRAAHNCSGQTAATVL